MYYSVFDDTLLGFYTLRDAATARGTGWYFTPYVRANHLSSVFSYRTTAEGEYMGFRPCRRAR